MKKILIFASIIIILFGLLIVITKSIEPEDLYKNSISFDELNKAINNNEDLIVYFYQTDCIYCKKTSPIVIPMAEEMNIDLKVFNLQEDTRGWEKFKIEGTPTIVHFKDGKEVSRLYGQQDENTFKNWFEKEK